MKTSHLSSIALACAIALPAYAAGAGRITAVPQPARQAPAPGVATFGLPSPSGLASPNPASLTPPGSPNLSSPGTAPGSPAIDAGVAVPVTPGGGGAVVQQSVGGANVMGAGPSFARGPYSAVEIARAYFDADTNHDGDLSRAEAQRLSIFLPVSFDDLDRNHDGTLSRFEYEDAFR